jgi:hypothetical protein
LHDIPLSLTVASPLPRFTALAAAFALGCTATPPPAPPAPRPAAAKAETKPAAPEPPPPPPLTGIAPCAQGSPDHEAAGDKLRGMSRTMKERKGAAFAEIVPAIKELLKNPCYRWAELEPPVHLEFDGPEALEKWWEAGGRSWLESYLQRPKDEAQQQRYIPLKVFPGPDVRRILNQKAAAAPAAAAERKALSWLLCPDSEGDCGKATSGWMKRADMRFSVQAYVDGFYAGAGGEASDEPVSEKGCGARALAAGRNERFRVYRACLERAQRRQWAMPLGRFRSPESGWLVIHGRRGHYEFCDELNVYDLATGSAYVAKSCSGLAFGNDGFVDNAQVDKKRKVKVTMGSLSIDNLRELAFMMLLAPEVERDLLLDPFNYSVSDRVAPVFSEGPRLERAKTFEGGGSWQSGLSWSLVKDGKETNRGAFTWPDSWNVAERYIDELLEVAEDGLIAGCPRAALPKGLPLDKAVAKVSPLDASAESVDTTSRDLAAALLAAKRPARCK